MAEREEKKYPRLWQNLLKNIYVSRATSISFEREKSIFHNKCWFKANESATGECRVISYFCTKIEISDLK